MKQLSIFVHRMFLRAASPVTAYRHFETKPLFEEIPTALEANALCCVSFAVRAGSTDQELCGSRTTLFSLGKRSGVKQAILNSSFTHVAYLFLVFHIKELCCAALFLFNYAYFTLKR